MTKKSDSSYTWIGVVIVGLVFGGYKAMTGRSVTVDLSRSVSGVGNEQKEAVQPIKPALTTDTKNTDQAQPGTLTDLQEQAIGFLAQTICSTRKYGYSPEEARSKIDYFVKAKDAEEIREWMMLPKVASAASTLSLAFNQNCTDFDAQSEYAKKAFRMMNSL